MPQLDGVKTPPSHKKKHPGRSVLAKAGVSARKAHEIPPLQSHSENIPEDIQRLSLEERQKLAWAGVAVVMAAVIGVWLWLLPTTLNVTAKRTETKDWENLQKGLSGAVLKLQTESPEEKRLRELRKGIFNDNQNTSIPSNTNTSSENTNQPIQNNLNINSEVNMLPDALNNNAGNVPE
ncbi:MAG TPA: hypothetical protein VJC11_03200 [Patescibacteria group bacterium]|nr:hypothetical protein [Patescibacteria group bacterium]